MGKFRIEYLPKPGMDVKMFKYGFESAEDAERAARRQLGGAVYANVTRGERIVKRLWQKEVCQAYLSDSSPYRCLKVFDGKEQLAEHVTEAHTYHPRRTA